MKKIPFYKNLKDNLHCTQACLKMALGYFFPSKNFTFAYLDKISGHIKGKGTWDTLWMLKLADMGLNIITIEILDYKKFTEQGEKYLQKLWNEAFYKAQVRLGNLKLESKRAKLFVKDKRIRHVKRQPSLSDIKKYIDKAVIFASINSCIINDCISNHHASHLVVLTKLTKSDIFFHDPGLPAIPNRKISLSRFKKALKLGGNNLIVLFNRQ